MFLHKNKLFHQIQIPKFDIINSLKIYDKCNITKIYILK